MLTIRLTAVSLLLVCGAPALSAQTATALQRAILIEEQEHDLKQAAELYQKITGDAKASAADRAMALLRLGKVLRQLGRQTEAAAALTKAAAGSGAVAAAARQLLQDKGGSDKDKQLRARARQILRDPELKDKAKHLLFIGQAAVPEMIRYYEELWAKRGHDRDLSRHELVRLLWQLGGEAASTHLRSIIKSDDIARRQELVDNLSQQLLHPSMLPTALVFCADPDPSGDIPLRALKGLQPQTIPSNRLLPLTGSAEPIVVRRVWRFLANKWGSIPVWYYLHHEADTGSSFKMLAPDLLRALASEDTEVRSAARTFLIECGSDSAAGRRILLQHLPDWARETRLPFVFGYDQRFLEKFEAMPPEASIADVVDAARRLGAFAPSDQRANWVQKICWSLSESWTRRSLPEVLELARMGYIDTRKLGEWLSKQKIQAADRVLAALDGPPLTRYLVDANFLTWLAKSSLTAKSWPTLHRAWRSLSDRPGHKLAECVAHTGADGAIDFLRELAETPASYVLSSNGLMEMAKRRQDEPLRAALRSLRFAQTGHGNRRSVIKEVTNRLLTLGDFATVQQIPAVNKTLAGSWVVPVDLLYELDPNPFSVAQREQAWRILLDDHDDYWTQAANSFGTHSFTGAGDLAAGLTEFTPVHCEPRLLSLFIDLVAQRLGTFLHSDKAMPDGYETLLGCVLSVPGSRVNADAAATRRIHELYTRCLKSPRKQFQAFALHLLQQRKPAAEHRPLVLRFLRDPHHELAGKAANVATGSMPMTLSEFAAAIQECNPTIRDRLAGLLPSLPRTDPKWDQIAASLGRTLLRDKSAFVRLSACGLLGRCADTEAVPDLLATLRDPKEPVRKAADQALRAIRFYHEQKAHWDRAFQGAAKLDVNSAAEALVKQADPKQPKATRLLAIESMGVLGKAETLPFLIGYNQESDAEIAAAAKAAIAAVHAKAAVKK